MATEAKTGDAGTLATSQERANSEKAKAKVAKLSRS